MAYSTGCLRCAVLRLLVRALSVAPCGSIILLLAVHHVCLLRLSCLGLPGVLLCRVGLFTRVCPLHPHHLRFPCPSPARISSCCSPFQLAGTLPASFFFPCPLLHLHRLSTNFLFAPLWIASSSSTRRLRARRLPGLGLVEGGCSLVSWGICRRRPNLWP